MFKDEVYRYLLTIPYGTVATYSQIAEALGGKNLARAVGNALHANPDGNKYPCYRVVSAAGKLSANYAFGGIEGQRERLVREGVEVDGYTVNLTKYQYKKQL